MTAKFFNAKAGEFVPMINESQANLSVKYNFTNPADYFYYRVDLDYEKQNYQVFNINKYQNIYSNLNNRAGATIPIKWYEYVNPQ